jgi:hypothetical protein
MVEMRQATTTNVVIVPDNAASLERIESIFRVNSGNFDYRLYVGIHKKACLLVVL